MTSYGVLCSLIYPYRKFATVKTRNSDLNWSLAMIRRLIYCILDVIFAPRRYSCTQCTAFSWRSEISEPEFINILRSLAAGTTTFIDSQASLGFIG